MYQTKLSADPNSLILAIISLFMAIILGCCGLSIIGLVLGIIGLISANKSLREYDLNPGAYLPNSRANVSTAKILNIIAIVLNGLITLVFILYFLINGVFLFALLKGIQQEIKQEKEQDTIYQYDQENEWESNEVEEDTLYNYRDSLNQE